MRILLITLFFPPKHNAGTENYTLGLAKTLLARSHDVHVLCAGDWETGHDYWNGVTEDVYEGVPVHRIQLNWTKADSPNQVLFDSPLVESWLNRFLNELKPDVVHATSVITLGTGALRAVRQTGIPLILTLTDFWFICPRIQLLRGDGSLCDGIKTAWECQSCLSTSSGLMQRLNRILPETVHRIVWGQLARYPWLTRQRGFRGILLDMTARKQVLAEALSIPDRVFAPSEFVQQMFIKNTSVRVEVLPHGHNLDWLKYFSGKTYSDKLRVGYIGQVQAIKGVHVLIEAFQRTKIDEYARLDIWGDLAKDLSYVQRLKTLIGDTTSITLHGRFERTHLAAVLANIDVLVVPSVWYENAPLVIQEAFAVNIPVITTNLGGMAEAVKHEINGLLFERGDEVDLARQLRRLVEEPGLLERLRAGVPLVKTIDEEVVELEAIYRGL